MPKGQPGAADRDLADQLAAAGVTVDGSPVTASMLQRWRQEGLLPQVAIERGGRRGSTSRYPDTALDAAKAVAASLTRKRSFRAANVSGATATLSEFGSGEAVDWQTLRTAYASFGMQFIEHFQKFDRAIDDRRKLSQVTDVFSEAIEETVGPRFAERWNSEVEIRLKEARSEISGRHSIKSEKRQLVADTVSAAVSGDSLAAVLSMSGLDLFIASFMGTSREEVVVANADVSVRITNAEAWQLNGHTLETLTVARNFFLIGLSHVPAIIASDEKAGELDAFFRTSSPSPGLLVAFLAAMSSPLSPELNAVYTAEYLQQIFSEALSRGKIGE